MLCPASFLDVALPIRFVVIPKAPRPEGSAFSFLATHRHFADPDTPAAMLTPPFAAA